MSRKEELQKIEEETSDLVIQARHVKIRSDPQYEQAAEFLLAVKSLNTQITDHHEPMRKKTHEAYQEVLAAKKRLLKPVQEAEGIVKKEMSKFMAERQTKQDRIAERVKEGKPGRVREAPKLQGVSTRQVWEYEVTSPSKVTRDFLTPDHVAIRELVGALGEDAAEIVGGIRVYQETKIAASRGV